ncbi:MAG: hypothetical protein Q7U73_00450 [Rubrivivax sp.]|nr:hypothetical protein [Rubrivivax sp.]
MQAAAGPPAARRLDALFDAHSLLESGMHACHDSHAFGLAGRDLPADGAAVPH